MSVFFQQLRDEQFEKEDNRFRNAEKAVKALLRSVMIYLERMRVRNTMWESDFHVYFRCVFLFMWTLNYKILTYHSPIEKPGLFSLVESQTMMLKQSGSH